MKMLTRTFSAILAVTLPAMSQVVFEDNFSSGTIVSNANPYYGGFYSPQISTSTWYGDSHSNISAGTLNSTSTSATRSAGIFLAPSLFFGSGLYSLEFDITSYSGDINDNAFVSIWQGSGYDLTLSSANSLQLDTFVGGLNVLGSASATQLVRTNYTTTGLDNTLNFTYNGTSGIALFFGARTAGFPFPNVKFDNIKLSAVPEPSSLTIFAVLSSLSLLKRRRA